MSPLREIKAEFQNEINSLILQLSEFNKLISKRSFSISNENIFSFYEITYLKIYLSWEKFLENSFISYVCGKYTNKCKPAKNIKNVNQDTAYSIIKGMSRYPNWTNAYDVIHLAKLHFRNGEPYRSPLNSNLNHLNEMTKIRNAITHMSIKSRDDFMALVRKKLTRYSADIEVGEFLRLLENNTKKEFIVYYIDFLKYASDEIIKT